MHTAIACNIACNSSPVPPEMMIPSSAEMAVIARQPIVDAKRCVTGYELLHRRLMTSEAVDEALSGTTDAALLFNALSNIGSESLFGNKLAFINCTHDALAGVHLEMVDPERIVLEVPPVADNAPTVIAVLADTLKDLKSRGYRLAFGASVLTRPYASWCALATYIKIDVRALKPEVLPAAVKVATTHAHAQVIAEKVESTEEFAALERLGVKLFQGYYFERPSAIAARIASPAYSTVIQLINLVRREADPGEIEELLKRDPTLSFKLLRYINSAGFGLGCEVTSFRHAVMILGLKKLFRWAALLLTTSRAGGVPAAVGTTAIVRGRLMELLAAELLPAEEIDNAFVVGVFSLLDTMLGMPMDKALDAISMPEPVVSALLLRRGALAPFLELTIACETGDDETFARCAEELQLSNRQVNLAHLQALAWAESLNS